VNVQQVINVGGYPNDPTADTVYTGFTKTNANFTTLFEGGGGGGGDGGLGISVVSFGADPTGVNDSTAAFNAAIASLTTPGGAILIPPGDYILSSTILIEGIAIAVVGAGRGVTRIHAQHQNIVFDCAPGNLTYKTLFRDLSIYAESSLGQTAGAIRITYPTSTSFGYVTTEIQGVEFFGYPNTQNGQTPYPQTFLRGVILNGTWSAQLHDLSWFGPPNDYGASGACCIEINGAIDTQIGRIQAYYGLSLVIQTGYCEGLYIVNAVVVGLGRVLVQTTQSGWTGYTSGKTSLLGLWIDDSELNTGAGTVQCAFLTLGSVTGCDITRNYGGNSVAVMFDFTDTSNFTISGCNFNGGSGGADIAIQFQAAVNSSGCIISDCRFANMATAINIIGSNGTAGLMARELNSTSLSDATAIIDGSGITAGNQIYTRGRASSAAPSGIASKRSFAWYGPDSTLLLYLRSIQGATDNLVLTPAGTGVQTYPTIGTQNGAPIGFNNRLNMFDYFARTVVGGLTATGTNQGTAYAITTQVSTFSTVASGTGAILPAALAPGTEIVIFNRGANALLVYPQSGGAIEQVSVNGSVSVTPGTTAIFTLESANQWRQESFGGSTGLVAVSTIAQLRAVPYTYLTDGNAAFVGNYGSNVTPIGGGTFKWNAASTATHDGIMTVAPYSISGAGRWLRAIDERFSINVLWCGAISSDSTDSTSAFTTARTLANQYACPIYVPAGRYLVNWTISDTADLWMVGEGTLIWQQAGTPLTVTRTPGANISLSGVTSILLGTVSGNAFVDEAVQTWVLQGIAGGTLPSISAGQIYSLNSQDNYPWALASVINGGSGVLQVWQGQLVRVQGICIPFSSGSGAFAEDQTVTGASSRATGVIRSVSVGSSGGTAGYIVLSSVSAAFTSGENLQVGGSTYGVCSGAAVVAIAEKIVDTYATSPQINLLTACKTIIDGLTFDVPAGSNVETPIGTANRLPCIILGNCIEPSVKNVTCKTGWTRFLQSLGCWQGDYDLRVSYLPNDANLSEGAYGYGVELGGPDTGARVKVIAKGVRHAFTTNVYWGGYSFMPLQVRGNPRSFLVYGSSVRDGYNAGFDTHWGCYEGRFENCRVDYTNHANRNVSASIGFQNRGYNTQYSGCEAVGCVNGYVDGYSNLGTPSPPSGQPAYLSTTLYLGCSAMEFQENGFLVSTPNTGPNNRQEYRNCWARGDGLLANTPYYQRGFLFDSAAYVRLHGCVVSRFNGAPMEFNGFGGRVEIVDCESYYRDNPGPASGIKFENFSSANAYEIYVSNYRVFSDVSTSAPYGIMRNASSGNILIGVSGFVGSVNTPATPLEDPTDTGSITFGWSTNRVVAAALTATGTNQATAYVITGQVNTFATVASGTGTVLPAQTGAPVFPIGLGIGSEIVVFNRGANALLVYPPSGAAIESGSTNAAVSLASGATARFTLESTNQWRQG
jgi:hypothetical protein